MPECGLCICDVCVSRPPCLRSPKMQAWWSGCRAVMTYHSCQSTFQHSCILPRDSICYGSVSVCLSVRPPQAGVIEKRLNTFYYATNAVCRDFSYSISTDIERRLLPAVTHTEQEYSAWTTRCTVWPIEPATAGPSYQFCTQLQNGDSD